jgi:hypothetical protein
LHACAFAITQLARAAGGSSASGQRRRKLLGIPKLDDANAAGGPGPVLYGALACQRCGQFIGAPTDTDDEQ